MGHNRNLADYAHHFDGTNIDLGSGNIETDGVVTYEDVTNVDAIGIVTARAGVKVPDNQKVFLGTGDDLQVYHSGTDSLIVDNSRHLLVRADGTGDLYLQSDNKVILSDIGNNETFIECNDNGNVSLYYDNSKKLETTTTGATVTGTLVSDSVTSELDLSAISSSISDTATNVFVYDTSKDSDGGAWRKRTKRTSWYQEELGTEYRGTRREFPAVAVIVVEDNDFTIYDGDDPDLPMWMKFVIPSYGPGANWQYECPGVAHASFYSISLTSCAMMNGQLVVTNRENGNHGGWLINFISEEIMDMTRYGVAANQFYRMLGPISARNDETGTQIKTLERYGNSEPDPLITGRISSADIWDSAITVRPNAPIDPDTGLPTPTIALSTQKGVDIIENGQLFFLTPESISNYDANKQFKQVDFTSDGHIVFTTQQSSGGYSNLIQLPRYNYNSNLSDNYTALPNSINYIWGGAIRDTTTEIGNWKASNTGEEWAMITPLSDSFVVANEDSSTGYQGIIRLGNYPDHLFVNHITSRYNTGWMFGKCEIATLADTNDTDLTNGQSETDLSRRNISLTAQGNIVKEPVATGAELMGYGGNGTSNYFLQSSHNAFLDLTTDVFSVSGWLYCTNVGGGQYIFDRSDTYNSSRDWQLWIAADLRYMTMYIDGGQRIVTLNNAFPNNRWFHFTVTRDTSHSLKIYINGKLEKTQTHSSSASVATSSNQALKILYNCDSNTRMSLFRITKSVIDSESVRKMYQEEKELFEENAKCTLYGSVDHVDALGSDSTEDILHVGTSAGRSDFQGLRRINNTTTAVTTAISASDELIAEQ